MERGKSLGRRRPNRTFWREEMEGLTLRGGGRGGVRKERGEEGRMGWGRRARATDQEPDSQGTEQVQAASEAFGPEGAARA